MPSELNCLADALLDGPDEQQAHHHHVMMTLKTVLTVAAGHVHGSSAGLYRFNAELSILTLILATDASGSSQIVDEAVGDDLGFPFGQFPVSQSTIARLTGRGLIVHSVEEFLHEYTAVPVFVAGEGSKTDKVLLVPIRHDRRLVGIMVLAASGDLPKNEVLEPELVELAAISACAFDSMDEEPQHFKLRASIEALNSFLTRQIAARRRAEKRAQTQSFAIAKTLSLLAAEPQVDRLLGHALQAILEALGGSGGAMWLPEDGRPGFHLYVACVGGRILTASEFAEAVASVDGPSLAFPSTLTLEEIRATPKDARADDLSLPDFDRSYLIKLGVDAIRRVPMQLGSEIVGWISIRHAALRDRSFHEDRSSVESLIGLATLAVHLSKLSRQSLDAAVMEERSRLVREMHDTILQQQTAVVVQLEAAASATRDAQQPEATRHFDQALRIARHSLIDTRRSVRALREETLESTNLSSALKTLVARARVEPRLQVLASIAAEVPPWPAHMRRELYRLAQEAITNAIRHAKAQKLTVIWGCRQDNWTLEIHDDGVGFDPGIASDGMGIPIMAERAYRVGGLLSIESTPGRGTRILVTRRS